MLIDAKINNNYLPPLIPPPLPLKPPPLTGTLSNKKIKKKFKKV